MAIIKQKAETKVKLAKKEITLSLALWAEVTAYAKFAGITGQPAAKREFIIEEALKLVLIKDEEFTKWKITQATIKAAKDKVAAAAKEVAATTTPIVKVNNSKN